MSSLFGANANAREPSLTDSIFGPPAASSSNGDLFAPPTRPPSRPNRRRKRPRTRAPSAPGSAAPGGEGGEKGESRDEALRRRRRQSQDEILDRLTLSLEDYGGGGGGEEELRADVRGLVKHHGLAILRGALSEGDVSRIAALADAARRRMCGALDDRKIPYNSPVNNTETTRFRELAVRCQGRMDARYDECDSTADGGEGGGLPDLSLVEGLAAAVLHGAEAPHLVYSGWIFSFPGSTDQPWHQDGSPLFETGTESLPSYALNVFCGLHERQLLELGPTEFVVGSHRMEPGDAMERVDGAVSAVLGRGDILLYDYRVCHRGTSNLSTTPAASSGKAKKGKSEGGDAGIVRKVLYLMYARPWFREHLNFGNKSLFERPIEKK